MQKSNKIAMLVIAVLVTVLFVYYSQIRPTDGGRQLVPAPRVSQAEETKATATDSTADNTFKPASGPATGTAAASSPTAASSATEATTPAPAADDEILARIRALNTTGDTPVSTPAATNPSSSSTEAAPGGNTTVSSPTTTAGTTPPESKPDSAAPASAVTTTTPAVTTPAAPTAPATTAKTYAIQAGDTFSSIAEKFLGSEKHWPLIAQENPRVDPAKLKIGQIIRIPESAEPPPAVELHDDSATPHADSAGNITYTVKADDTLSSIAKQYYGSSAKWEVIHQANLSVIGDDPGRLKLGMKLIIPGPTQEAR